MEISGDKTHDQVRNDFSYTGQVSPKPVKRPENRSVAAITMVAVALAGCANYETTLQYPSGQKAEEVAYGNSASGDPRFMVAEGFECGPDTVLTLPKPIEAEVVVSGDPEIDNPSGWVHFRFDVNEEGHLSRIEVVRSSNPQLEFAAKQLLNRWEFEPATVDGESVAFTDMEIVMGFSETTTPGEVIGMGVLVVVLLPLALVTLFLAAVADDDGYIKFE